MSDITYQAQYKHISGTGAGTTVLKDSAGQIDRIVIPLNKTGTALFYDTPLASGTTASNLIYAISNTVGTIPTSITLEHRVKDGCVIIVGGTTDFTVIYQ